MGHAVAGATGTAISNVLVYPLDLVVTRLQVQQKKPKDRTSIEDDSKYEGVQDAVRKIYHNEGGLPAFYAGITQDTFKAVADSFLFFLFYSALLRARHNRSSEARKGLISKLLDEVGIGILAGAITRALTAPIQQVITRKQTMAMTSAAHSKDSKPHELGREQSVRDILTNIYETKGLQGLWSGYSATVILTLNPSLTMSIDSFLQRLASRRVDLGPAITFLLAATSKATASSIMYPVSLAKTRAQAASANESAEVNEKQQKKSGPGSVLTMIPKIAQKDGVGSLYAGLSGEVVKGFFSHGLTMLVKHRIHALVIQIYFLLLRYIRRLRAR